MSFPKLDTLKIIETEDGIFSAIFYPERNQWSIGKIKMETPGIWEDAEPGQEPRHAWELDLTWENLGHVVVFIDISGQNFSLGSLKEIIK